MRVLIILAFLTIGVSHIWADSRMSFKPAGYRHIRKHKKQQGTEPAVVKTKVTFSPLTRTTTHTIEIRGVDSKAPPILFSPEKTFDFTGRETPARQLRSDCVGGNCSAGSRVEPQGGWLRRFFLR